MTSYTRASLYNQAKAAGLITRNFRDYTNAELLTLLRDAEIEVIEVEVKPRAPYGSRKAQAGIPPQPPPPEQYLDPQEKDDPTIPMPAAPAVPYVNQADPDEMPGQRLNTKSDEDVIRIDEQGRHWLQEEVRKPAYPKPRGRRVLKYLERGVQKMTVQNGEYIEEFEVAGEGTPRPAEVKITLPSYQVGIYRDPRFPFRIHCYNGNEGFNLYDVEMFYGGSEMVPETCKRVYVENDLCYDIRSVIRAIQEEHRRLQLTGRL